jgi:hypothetical protein
MSDFFICLLIFVLANRAQDALTRAGKLTEKEKPGHQAEKSDLCGERGVRHRTRACAMPNSEISNSAVKTKNAWLKGKRRAFKGIKRSGEKEDLLKFLTNFSFGNLFLCGKTDFISLLWRASHSP